MKFTIESINDAHVKYTGIEFPKLVREFKFMNIVKNGCNIEKGLRIYVHQNGDKIEAQGISSENKINTNSSKKKQHKY